VPTKNLQNPFFFEILILILLVIKIKLELTRSFGVISFGQTWFYIHSNNWPYSLVNIFLISLFCSIVKCRVKLKGGEGGGGEGGAIPKEGALVVVKFSPTFGEMSLTLGIYLEIFGFLE